MDTYIADGTQVMRYQKHHKNWAPCAHMFQNRGQGQIKSDENLHVELPLYKTMQYNMSLTFYSHQGCYRISFFQGEVVHTHATCHLISFQVYWPDHWHWFLNPQEMNDCKHFFKYNLHTAYFQHHLINLQAITSHVNWKYMKFKMGLKCKDKRFRSRSNSQEEYEVLSITLILNLK